VLARIRWWTDPDRKDRMAKFVIAPHMRRHEWIARDKGYFECEGLQYAEQDSLPLARTGEAN